MKRGKGNRLDKAKRKKRRRKEKRRSELRRELRHDFSQRKAYNRQMGIEHEETLNDTYAVPQDSDAEVRTP
jgi:hypothetical protein